MTTRAWNAIRNTVTFAHYCLKKKNLNDKVKLIDWFIIKKLSVVYLSDFSNSHKSEYKFISAV